MTSRSGGETTRPQSSRDRDKGDRPAQQQPRRGGGPRSAGSPSDLGSSSGRPPRGRGGADQGNLRRRGGPIGAAGGAGGGSASGSDRGPIAGTSILPAPRRSGTPDYSQVRVLRAQNAAASPGSGTASHDASSGIAQGGGPGSGGNSPRPASLAGSSPQYQPSADHHQQQQHQQQQPPQPQPVRYLPGSTFAVKLVDRQGRFQAGELRKLLSDNPLSLVVAAIGRSGVGKSTLLSQFSLQPNQAFPTRVAIEDGLKTFGIDALVTPGGRVILLDVQANSVSKGVYQLSAATRSGDHHGAAGSPVPGGGASAGGGGAMGEGSAVDLLNVQVTTWLLAVADVVLLVGDETLDREIMHCLRLAQELVVQTPQVPGVAHVVYVKNKVPSAQFTPHTFARYLSFLGQQQLQHSVVRRPRGRGHAEKHSASAIWNAVCAMQAPLPFGLEALSLTAIIPPFGAGARASSASPNVMRGGARGAASASAVAAEANGGGFGGGDEGYGVAGEAGGGGHGVALPAPNAWLLPDTSEDPDEYPLPFPVLAGCLRDQVLRMRRRKMLLESEWLRLAAQLWDYIKRSGYLLGE